MDDDFASIFFSKIAWACEVLIAGMVVISRSDFTKRCHFEAGLRR